MRTFSYLICYTLCLTFIIMAPSAYAVEINDEGAKKFKTLLSDYIEEQRSMITPLGADIEMKGDITIEQGSNYYAATLPAITYKTVTGEKIKFGLTAINAIPTDNPDNWKISMAIPTPILMIDKDDQTDMQIDIGKQNIGGLWSFKLKNFSKLAAQYDDIKFTNTKNSDIFGFAKASIQMDLKEKKDKLWSGPTKFSGENFYVDTAELKNAFTIGKIENTTSMEGFSPQKYKDAGKNLITQNSNSPSLSPFYSLVKTLGDFDSITEIKNIKFKDPGKNINAGLKNVRIGYNAKTSKDGKLNVTANSSYSGLNMPKTTDGQNLIPQDFKTSFTLKNLPMQDIIELGQKTINSDPSEKQAAQKNARNLLLQKFKDIGTTLSLDDTKFGNTLYNVNIDGKIKADPSSKMGGVGSLNIQTTGLDTIMKELQKSPRGSAMAQQLTMFRMISDEKGNKNTAKIKLNKDGNITINGKDMSALMGGGGAQQVPAQ